MNRENFDKLVEETMKATAALLIAKGAEYAGDADRLINFKRNAIKNGQTVLETWQTYWGKHIDSINSYMARVKADAVNRALYAEVQLAGELSKKGEMYIPDEVRFKARINESVPAAMKAVDAALSEPIEGRFHDNINYSVLCLALIKELRDAGAELDQRAQTR